jgi:hypothetical protein
MVVDLQEEQQKEWSALYDQIRGVLQQFGQEDDFPDVKDYLLVDDNLGLYQHRVETDKLEFAQPAVVASLQKVLIGYPNWEIVIALGRFGGLVIRDDEIIDGLQRQHLPEELQTIEYEGSRPQGSQFGDLMYSGPWRF